MGHLNLPLSHRRHHPLKSARRSSTNTQSPREFQRWHRFNVDVDLCTITETPRFLNLQTPTRSPDVAMDAPENELDVKLHRESGELIAAFDERLAPFLRKPDGSGGYRIRSRVRTREAVYLMSNVSRMGCATSMATAQLTSCSHSCLIPSRSCLNYLTHTCQNGYLCLPRLSSNFCKRDGGVRGRLLQPPPSSCLFRPRYVN